MADLRHQKKGGAAAQTERYKKAAHVGRWGCTIVYIFSAFSPYKLRQMIKNDEDTEAARFDA
ncbi:MAG: hypothetical protein KDD73_16360 [Anaerolineales bacterium]|nr:hypothetical protein [Anaerolineales bacterium]